MLEIFTWVTAGISVIGVILNAQKKIISWYFWMVADLSWVGIGFYTKTYALSALFLFYFFLCFYGLYLWRKPQDIAH